MAGKGYEANLVNITLSAHDDYSAKQYYAVDLNSSEEAELVSSQGAESIGILQNTPSANGRPATVAVGGISRAVAGETIAAGARVTPTADGTFMTAASGDYVAGRAMVAAVSGDIFCVFLSGPGQDIVA